MCALCQVRFKGEVPRPKNKGVVKMMVRGRTFASRKSGIMHPRKTTSSLAGP